MRYRLPMALLGASLLTACAGYPGVSPRAAAEPRPMIRIDLLQADQFRLTSGFLSSDLTGEATAVATATGYCQGRGAMLGQQNWSVSVAGEADTGPHVRIGSLTFSCVLRAA